ncbi:DUF423 domain-containing protein [Ekhidna sp.]|uniref:DUF423 domain-containing protein n=1 Tax=Ekhidna sp. TaxID=2608089 RepID=UPI003515437E
MHKLFLIISSISGILAVGLGAFGAHALKSKLETEGTLDIYQTAVQYQFYHTLALLGIALLMTKIESQWLTYAGYSITLGILIFSGSLYVLCFTGMKWLGAVTPIGGLMFIAGWLCLLMTAIKSL